MNTARTPALSHAHAPLERWCEASEDDWLVEHVLTRSEVGVLERWIASFASCRLSKLCNQLHSSLSGPPILTA